VEAVRMAKKIGYYVSATFIYGLPGDTHQNRVNCISLSKKLKMDMVRYNNATPYPGTELYKVAKKDNRLNVVGLYENFCTGNTFVENPFKRTLLPYVPKGNSEEEIRMDILYSHLSFYLDFARLRNIFSKSDRGVGWFKVGERTVEVIKKIPDLSLLFFLLVVKFTKFYLDKLVYLVLKIN
jgi:radical SAM superfamily enzyme YgiQ (UPF0313 family)